MEPAGKLRWLNLRGPDAPMSFRQEPGLPGNEFEGKRQ